MYNSCELSTTPGPSYSFSSHSNLLMEALFILQQREGRLREKQLIPSQTSIKARNWTQVKTQHHLVLRFLKTPSRAGWRQHSSCYLFSLQRHHPPWPSTSSYFLFLLPGIPTTPGVPYKPLGTNLKAHVYTQLWIRLLISAKLCLKVQTPPTLTLK